MDFGEQDRQPSEGTAFDEPSFLVTAEAGAMRVEAEVDEEIARTVPDSFAVESAETATWVIRRIVEARKYAARVKLWAEMEQRRALREEQRLLYLFGGQLQRWTETELSRLKGKRRSVTLPGGMAGFRSMPSKIVFVDESAVMRWARKECPSAIVISERLLKTPISEHVQKTGEVPEGVEITTPRSEFFVR